VVFLKDAAGRYILLNRRCEERFDLTEQDALGKTDYDLFPAQIAETLRAHDREVLERGQGRGMGGSGSPGGWTATPTSPPSFPCSTAAGVAHAVGGIATDITERKRAERALRESEEWFRSLSDCSPVGVYLTDIEGRATYTNPRCQEIYGFSLEESLGDGWSRFIHPDDQSLVLETWTRLATARG